MNNCIHCIGAALVVAGCGPASRPRHTLCERGCRFSRCGDEPAAMDECITGRTTTSIVLLASRV